MRSLLIAAWLAACGWWAWQAHAYVPVWHTEASLARHAARMAPLKPRTLLNYGVRLVAEGRLSEAERAFQWAIVTSSAPHVRRFDRLEAQDSGARNLAALKALRRRAE